MTTEERGVTSNLVRQGFTSWIAFDRHVNEHYVLTNEIDLPWALEAGWVFDLKCRSCGRDRRYVDIGNLAGLQVGL